MIAGSIAFHLPLSLNASAPPERRGVRRDHVRMMVLSKETGHACHDQFYHLDRYLASGDVLVLNNSRTIPAILKGRAASTSLELEIRLARKIDDRRWHALLVSTEGVKEGETIVFSAQLQGVVEKTTPDSPLSMIRFSKSGTSLFNEIYSIGEPVRYEYIEDPWDLDYYQTVFASHPGSVEMPSAGRAFTWEMLFKLRKKGVKITFIQLHTGLSYFLNDRWDHHPSKNTEQYIVPTESWNEIISAKLSGKRVIAAGTTVVRALETAIETNELSGWTNLYIHPGYQLKVADGILTGLHEPEASHLAMLSAFISQEKLCQAYQEAVEEKYLWHEFGDMNLIL
ncbi:S-adenosylmethionine:tRNA ribosyltransferase-isomerase [Neobacillus notoginsengisoli]|uniref:S-adenosylmethionine:tRNA ribosyltransferase-isomerase n=1 Tax=Neobacillus notoginsengisoli TaxID=1578198 RepID=A0A417YX08_9BACI|nr:S-adenosylmethionine:tRNA ribosyltransferase-isomerase [Neobacillus notoginsengisoli]RHW42059.1 S-adenosylmethionine:tRNA ribosyltransferase-isomerase [Neobacillus notoginsengisoli]